MGREVSDRVGQVQRSRVVRQGWGLSGGIILRYPDVRNNAFTSFTAKPMPRRVAFLIFPRFQLLDAAGPISAFEIAAGFARELRAAGGRRSAGSGGELLGAILQASALGPAGSIDTLIVPAVRARAARSAVARPGSSSSPAPCGRAVSRAWLRLLPAGRRGTPRWTHGDHALELYRGVPGSISRACASIRPHLRARRSRVDLAGITAASICRSP